MNTAAQKEIDIPIDPQTVTGVILEDPHFDNRLLAGFFREKVDPNSLDARKTTGGTQWVQGTLLNSALVLKLEYSTDGTAALEIRHPLGNRLAYVYRHNMIGSNHHVGGLKEGSNFYSLNNPNNPEVFRLIAELAEKNKQSRNIDTMIGNYPPLQNQAVNAYFKLLGEFTNPTRLRLEDSHRLPPKEILKAAGILEDSRLYPNETAVVVEIVRTHGYMDDRPICYIDWPGDNGEESAYLQQTVFSFKGGSFVAQEEGLKPYTARYELSGQMLEFLNKT